MQYRKAKRSFWENEVYPDQYHVVIIGGGIVGLNTAIELKEEDPRLNILIIERGLNPIGASTRNAGFACFGSLSEILADLEDQDESEVVETIQMRWMGLKKLKARVGTEAMEYQTCGSYELFDHATNELYENAIDKLYHINQLLKYEIGPEAFKKKDEDIATFGLSQTNHLIFSQYEGQLHPGKMMISLYEMAVRMGVRFLYGHEVAKIYASNKAGVQLKNGVQLRGEILILANNAFSKDLIPELEVQAARNQVLISEPNKHLKIKQCFHYNQGYTYFRNVGDRLLIGGARNLDLLNEATGEFGLTTKIQDFLKQFIVQKNLLPPKFKIETQWSGILGIGKSKKPIIKEVKSNTFAAVRLGGMGIAIGTLVAEKIVNEVLNR